MATAWCGEWKVALPLHPEFGTQANVFYVPPLAPAPLREDGSYDEGGARIPPSYLEELFGPRGARRARRAARRARPQAPAARARS